MGQRQNITSSLQIQRATFLPMLCSRPSIKNVTIPTKSQSHPLQDQEDDPLSPKISCIGQVKRNNRITNLPTNTALHIHNNAKLAITTTTKHNHYFKLKRLFSGKTLALTLALSKPTNTANTCTPTTTTTTTRRRRTTEESSVKNMKGSKIDESNKGFVVDVVDMDPPLPVVKKKHDGGEKAPENLWKRRSGGLELRGLQIQQIQKNMAHHQMQLIPTV